ncbi:MAG: YdcF family protein [Nitrospirota bacterium]
MSMNLEIRHIIDLLINPLFYLLLGIVLQCFFKKHRIRMTAILFISSYLLTIPFTAYAVSRIWKADDTFRPDVGYDAAVVLAGFSESTWHLERHGLPYIPPDFFASNDATDRILAGIHFVKSGHARLLLVGKWFRESRKYGSPVYYDEEMSARKLALEMGLKDEQIHFYGKVKRTLNEAEGVKRFVDSRRPGRVLLITCEIHMRRALALFHKQGIYPDTFSVNKEKGITLESFIPGVAGIEKTKSCLHEIVGYAGHFLSGDL